MASISLQHIYKRYPLIKSRKEKKADSKNKTPFKSEPHYAVKDFNLEIEDGEFVVFVGPSGCGKSTTLRMIAGLEDITAGKLFIDGELANNKEPKDRDISMVFQSYALYPQMSAYDNIAFGLKIRKIPEEVKDKNGNVILVVDKKQISEIKKKIKVLKKDTSSNEGQIEELEAQIEELKSKPSTPKLRYKHMKKKDIDMRVQSVAEILNIKELLYRKPADMSGGQRQRVALGRCMVRQPKVFLLDEPLSNLDAKLRASMRGEIVKLHKAIKTTFVYVTHDQIEAMTMGDKIVVMKDGIIQQVDKPTNLYDYPKNKFVAGFIGTPQMNFFDVDFCVNDDVEITFKDGQKINYPLNVLRNIKDEFKDGSAHHAYLGVRGEHIRIAEKGLDVLVDFVEDLGKETQIFVKTNKEGKEFVIDYPKRCGFVSGDSLKVEFDGEHIHLFDFESEESIFEGAGK